MWPLPAASRRESRWKNGGGRTFEVASDPPGSALASFNWRISIAEIAQPGPFSSFMGVERTLTLVQGGPLTLHFGEEERLLTSPFDQISFAGERIVESSPSSPAWVVNVMSRRGSHQHQVRKARDGEWLQAPETEILVLISLGEGLRIGEASLGRFDAVQLMGSESASIEVADEIGGLVVTIGQGPKLAPGRTRAELGRPPALTHRTEIDGEQLPQ